MKFLCLFAHSPGDGGGCLCAVRLRSAEVAGASERDFFHSGACRPDRIVPRAECGWRRTRRARWGAALMLPAYCRVAATLKPSADSDIKMEVWMPVSENWNGKIEVVGNGGWAGVISYAAMAQALKEGYAAASTDTGHTGGNGMFALGHPEKIVDFGYRAVHETVDTSKAIDGGVTTAKGRSIRTGTAARPAAARVWWKSRNIPKISMPW